MHRLRNANKKHNKIITRELPAATDPKPSQTEVPAATDPVPPQPQLPAATDPNPPQTEAPAATDPNPPQQEEPAATDPNPQQPEEPAATDPKPPQPEEPAPKPVDPQKPTTVCFFHTSYDADWIKPCEPREKFVQMRIGDLLQTNWHDSKFEGRRYVNIVGTIVGIYTNISEKIQLIVDDSTGSITCVVEPQFFNRRTRLNNRTEKREAEREDPEPAVDLIGIIKEQDGNIIKESRRNQLFNRQFQEECSYIMLQKAKFLTKDYPQKRDLLLCGEAFGQHVSITGKVYDWTEQRVIYAWNVKFISLDEFFIWLGQIKP